MRLLCIVVLALALAACDKPQGTAPASQVGNATSSRAAVPKTGSTEARRLEFLNRVRQADPRYQIIDRALMNERNELGVILKRDVDLNDIPKLMRSLLTEMAREFPGQDLTVVAYAPTNPPRQIGIGRLNASTREMTYTPAN